VAQLVKWPFFGAVVSNWGTSKTSSRHINLVLGVLDDWSVQVARADDPSKDLEVSFEQAVKVIRDGDAAANFNRRKANKWLTTRAPLVKNALLLAEMANKPAPDLSIPDSLVPVAAANTLKRSHES